MKTRSVLPQLMAHVIAALVLLANAAAATPSSNAASDAAFNRAAQQYRNAEWSAAYGRFAALADKGHAEAARIALHMLRHGTKLYGHEWGASQPQIERWAKLALQRMEAPRAESGD